MCRKAFIFSWATYTKIAHFIAHTLIWSPFRMIGVILGKCLTLFWLALVTFWQNWKVQKQSVRICQFVPWHFLHLRNSSNLIRNCWIRCKNWQSSFQCRNKNCRIQASFGLCRTMKCLKWKEIISFCSLKFGALFYNSNYCSLNSGALFLPQ